MGFNTISFLVFFPIVTLLFFIFPPKYRWIHLLAASCYFYMYFIPAYIFILLITILIDYFAGIWIQRNKGIKRNFYLIISIISTCLVLFVFKYFNFFNDNVQAICSYFHVNIPDRKLNMLLPIGLSFHTFQSLSYVIEVYRGHQKAEKHFGIYALYVMFYPQLVTGPIERPQNFLRQLREIQVLRYDNLINGLRLILFGLFLKMVIADNLAPYVDEIYKAPHIYGSLSVLTAIVFYSFQIYCDFLGYSTIAVGCALTMGFKLIDNFKSPYLARSINEFWQRWHISLSTWFRDYVYFSLGGNRVIKVKWIFNICIVFIISGLWHGANYTFIIWGALFAFFYLTENFISKIIRLPKAQSSFSAHHLLFIFSTFLIVSFLWVIFRSQNMQQAKEIYAAVIQNWHIKDNFIVDYNVWVLLILFVVFDIVLYNSRFDVFCSKISMVFRWVLYSTMLFLIIVFSGVENYPFIYFQF